MRSNPNHPSSRSEHQQLAEDLRRTRADSLIQPPRGMITNTIDQLPERRASRARAPRSHRTTEFLLAAAAALTLTTLAWFLIPAAPNTRASEALSQSLSVLPKANFAQLLLAPAERETRSLVLQTQRATDSLRFSLPITRLP